jgi:hypothetical protein
MEISGVSKEGKPDQAFKPNAKMAMDPFGDTERVTTNRAIWQDYPLPTYGCEV